MGESASASDTSHLDPAMKRIGAVLGGKWTLNRLLGIGGMAAVYAATHRNGARAAIKLFPFSVTTSAEFAERILREGVLANKIGHPAVVRVLDDHLDREREHAYLVMELLEGETARQRIERLGPMSPVEAVDFSMELLHCLATAHEKGVVHRDIKPENLFLTDDGTLKVLDFGVARAIDNTSSSVTRTGAMLGTPAYMSPEQARGRPSEISPRSDIYSAGATLLFLLTGEFVHEGESAQEIMVRAAWTPANKTSERGLGLPIAIADVIDKACAFDQVNRYQTAAEMRRALETARTLLSSDVPTSGSIVRVRPRSTSNVPTLTAPLPLRVARPDQPTLVENDAEPAGLPNRRRVWIIAGSAAAVALTSFVVFLSFGSADSNTATAVEPASSATPARPPVAAVVAASRAPEPPPESAPAPAAPSTRAVAPRSGASAARPAPKRPPSRSGAPSIPVTTAPQKPAATPISRLSPERDVGY
jgi:serine/threonine-protein kinase